MPGYLQTVDSVGVAGQRVQALLSLGVPHLHHVVVRAGHHQLAVVLNAPGRKNDTSVTPEFSGYLLVVSLYNQFSPRLLGQLLAHVEQDRIFLV